jgi:hypothetical protein
MFVIYFRKANITLRRGLEISYPSSAGMTVEERSALGGRRLLAGGHQGAPAHSKRVTFGGATG